MFDSCFINVRFVLHLLFENDKYTRRGIVAGLSGADCGCADGQAVAIHISALLRDANNQDDGPAGETSGRQMNSPDLNPMIRSLVSASSAADGRGSCAWTSDPSMKPAQIQSARRKTACPSMNGFTRIARLPSG